MTKLLTILIALTCATLHAQGVFVQDTGAGAVRGTGAGNVRGYVTSTSVANIPTYGYNSTNVVPGALWTGITNAFVEDGVYAECFHAGDATDLYLNAFGFNIPSTAEIRGIILKAKLRADGNPYISLAKGYSETGTEYYVYNSDFPVLWFTNGASTNLCGLTWTPSEINSTNFCVRFKVEDVGQAYLDAVTVEVFYVP